MNPSRRSRGRRPKLLVVLGAGSSIPLGMPSVGELGCCMRRWAEDWTRGRSDPNYYALIENAAVAYAQSGPASVRPIVNFERILGDMVALIQWVTPAPFGASLRQFACGDSDPPGLTFPHPGRYGPSIAVKGQLQELMTKLAIHMRHRSAGMDSAPRPMLDYRGVFEGLRAAFDVGVYNLNYDTAALAAWPEAHTGFGPTGAFTAESVHDRRNWGFIYHLHGSVHHSLTQGPGDRIEWRGDLAGDFDDSHQGLPNDERSDGKTFPKTTLIAGGAKLDQLLVEPFHSLHAAFVRHVYEADAILIGGYGFGDVHVNRALRNRLDGRPCEERPPMLVLDHAGERTDSLSNRRDLWSTNLTSTLSVDGFFFREAGLGSVCHPRQLADRQGFELAPDHRTAVWYGGFERAVGRLDNIVEWLSGGDNNVLAAAAPPP